MPIDTSIYGQIQQPQQINPLASLAQAYQVKGLQSQMDRADREEAQQNKLLQLVGDPSFSNLDAKGKARALQEIGAFDKAASVITSEAAANKDARAAEGSQIANTMKKMEAMGQIMAGVKDQASYDVARQQAAQMFGPEAAANIPSVYDPNEVARRQQQAMSVKDSLAQQLQQQGQQITMRGQDMTQQTALRGQNMVDARAKESAQSGRIPSGYRQAADGSLEFIPGGPADPASKAGGGKPLTEGQSKALLFGTRMQEANDILENLATKNVDRPGLIKQGAEALGVGGAANWTQSEGQQQVEQAQRDFINATLRRESGAAIATSEFQNAQKQYFPQIGDSDAVKAQKKRNREVAMRGILAEVPDGESRVGQVRGQPAQAASPKQDGTLQVTDAASYAKVPSGATYMTPDGKMRRKP